jgi:hypothetical protein
VTLGFVALVAAGVVLIAAAVELLAAVVDRHVSIWKAVPLPHSHDGRVLVIVVLLAGSVALAALALRARPAALALSVEGGSLLLPPDTLDRFLSDELARDPDVVSSRAWCTLRDERLSAQLWVALRPLAPAAALRERLGGVATAALRDELGLAADVREPVVKVLRVHELPRHLR